MAGPYKNGTTVRLTATFNEAMAGSPVPQIAISAVTGGIAQSATPMAYGGDNKHTL